MKPLYIFIAMIFISTSLYAEDAKSSASTKAPANKEMTDKAQKVALAWLKLIDHGKYDQTWAESTEMIQKLINKKDWHKKIEAVRAPLGKVISRTLMSAKYMTKLPGAADGKYVVIQFKSVFKNKKEAIETITPQKVKSGWRIAGYYIK